MGAYKLIALDMDGTLLNENQHISAANREAIYAALEAGITVMISSGRGVQNILPYVEELQLRTPIVSVNGSEVWKEPYVLQRRTLMDTELIRGMHRLASRYDAWYWAYAVEGIFNKEQWPDDISSLQWLKFGFHIEDEQSLAVIRDTLVAWDTLEVTNSHPFNLELNPKGISKASGLREVCGMLGIDMSQVVAMGDSLNDIAMIRAAGLGVAMGNAQDAVKREADLVTAANDEDGVAKVIREVVLKEV